MPSWTESESDTVDSTNVQSEPEPEPEPESDTVLAAPRMEGHHLAIDLETKWHWRHWTGSCCW